MSRGEERRQKLRAARALSPSEAKAREREGTLVLIDVRERSERQDDLVAGAISIPLSELTRSLARIPKGVPLAFLCRTGRRSAAAARIARRAGYEAHNVAGGLRRWWDDGPP